MPFQLKNLTVEEVSSVDRGAGEGVRILLMKRAKEAIEKHDDVIDFTLLRKTGHPDFVKLSEAASALRKSIDSINADETVTDKDAAIEQTIKQFNEFIAGFVPAITEAQMTKEEIAKLIADGIKAGVSEVTKSLNDKITKLEFDNVVLKMSDKHKAHMDGLKSDDAKGKFAAMSPDDRDAECAKIAKANETDPVLKVVQEENVSLKKRLELLEGERQVAIYEKRATDLGLEKAHGDILRKAYSGDSSAQTKLDELLKGLANQVRTGAVFKEFGANQTTQSGQTAYDQLMAKAHDLRNAVNKSADKPMSVHQAFDKVFNDPANLDLREQHKREEEARRRAAA